MTKFELILSVYSLIVTVSSAIAKMLKPGPFQTLFATIGAFAAPKPRNLDGEIRTVRQDLKEAIKKSSRPPPPADPKDEAKK